MTPPTLITFMLVIYTAPLTPSYTIAIINFIIGTCLLKLPLFNYNFQLNVTLANLVRCKEKCASITDALSPIIKRCTTLHTAIQSLTQLNSKYIIPFKTFKSWIVESIESTQPPQTPQVHALLYTRNVRGGSACLF